MTFEGLEARASRRARERARARREALAAELGEALPGVGAEAVGEGVRLSGRGLKRRFARDSALRWLIAEKVR